MDSLHVTTICDRNSHTKFAWKFVFNLNSRWCARVYQTDSDNDVLRWTWRPLNADASIILKMVHNMRPIRFNNIPSNTITVQSVKFNHIKQKHPKSHCMPINSIFPPLQNPPSTTHRTHSICPAQYERYLDTVITLTWNKPIKATAHRHSSRIGR